MLPVVVIQLVRGVSTQHVKSSPLCTDTANLSVRPHYLLQTIHIHKFLLHIHKTKVRGFQ